MQPFRTIDEARRLEALRQYSLDSSPEPAFDDLTALAARICEAPISLISLVDERRQWYKSKLGLPARGIPRDISFCRYTIHQPELFIVPDAAQDERFAGDPLVTGRAHIRFYAGAPLLTSDGQALGALCVMDRVPRQLNAVAAGGVACVEPPGNGAAGIAPPDARGGRERGAVVSGASQLPDRPGNQPHERRHVYRRELRFLTSLLGWTRKEVAGHTAAELHLVDRRNGSAPSISPRNRRRLVRYGDGWSGRAAAKSARSF